MEPRRVLYLQAHIPPAGTSNRLARLGVQRLMEAAHGGGVLEQWLTLRNPSSAQLHWYLQQLLSLPQAAPEHRRQDSYATHLVRLCAQGFPQAPRPTLQQGQGREALLQGPPIDATTAVQQRGHRISHGVERDGTNCGVAARTAPCRHLTRDTRGLGWYRLADRTALASTGAAVTMEPVVVLPAHLLPHVTHQDARPDQPAETDTPTVFFTAELLYSVAAALLEDSGESFMNHNGTALITGSILGLQHNAPHLWRTGLRERTRRRDTNGGTMEP